MKTKKALFLTLLYILCLCGSYVAHIRFFKVDVVLYSALVDACLAVAVVGVILLGAKRFRVFNPFEKSQLLVIWLLLGCLAAFALPALIDRSLSFYLLEKIQQRGGGIRYDRFGEVFGEYIHEHHLAEVRLTEQEKSGTITIVNGCVKLTGRGERLAEFSRFFRLNLLPRQRLLLGRYSDDLVDPFRNDSGSPGYECR